jgi:two-component system sensor histidine kinase YesM
MKRFPFKSIQSHIALAFAGLILFTVLCMSLVSYHLSTDAVRQNAQEYTAELIKQVNANIQTYIQSMENISLLALNNSTVKVYLSKKEFSGNVERTIYEEQISDFFHAILVSRKDIASINIFGYNGQFVSDRPEARLNPNIDVKQMPWYRQAKEAGGKVVLSPSHVEPIFQNDYRWVVSLSRELKTPDGEGGGILLVDLNFSVINDMVSHINLGKRGYLFIVDNSGNIVYHPQQQLIYSNLKTERIDEVLRQGSGSFIIHEGEQSRIYTIQDYGFGWKIVGVSYLNELVGNKNQMKLSFGAWGAVSLAIAIGLSVLVSRTLTRPIKQLQKHMKAVEKGNFDIQVPVGHTREIGHLARTFNIMVGEIKNLMSQIVREQNIKRKSELNALQAQINPHFLYNTLDSIIWMAEAKKSEEVVLMTSALARMFRSSIGKGEELVPIRTEIEHITNYLIIQKMRYKDKLDFRIDADPDILCCKTLKIVLQPLVENAIYHGIKNKFGAGTIAVTAEKSERVIRIAVSDNGAGMDAEKLKTILMPKADSMAEGKGVGVINVHERIRLYFGNEYGLSYESEPDRGTKVTLTIPVIGPEGGEDER